MQYIAQIEDTGTFHGPFSDQCAAEKWAISQSPRVFGLYPLHGPKEEN